METAIEEEWQKIGRRSRRNGRNEPQKINVRIDGSDRPVHQPPINFISTQPDLQHHSSKSHFSSYFHHQKQGNLIRINPSQNGKGLTVSVNAQSVGPKEKRTEIVELVKDECVDILFLTETWMKSHGDESKCVDLTPRATSCGPFLVPRVMVDWP